MFISDAVTPQARMREMHARGVRQIERARIAAFGLPRGWNGDRSTGATSFSTGVTRDADGVTAEIHESIELVHVSGASVLRVESCDEPRPIGECELRQMVGGAGTVDTVTIAVDGRSVEFARATHAELFVARWVGYEATVTVRGERWPTTTGLELVRITDFTAYHEGRRRMLEGRSGFDLRD